ncbi:addiction module toxin RelE [Salinivibrio sp. PR6]|uniref:type II toxin-antitoxin system RelE/ParE family toxin n=1 Tax=Salinivibrio sp. PR6 TaxID=1909485 RepID=UPI00098976A8|nr:type II toxin-antitoxin system RelE/ParE family toxin [Salinivibrio sp. PR6]OOE85093.1 addiction module toxin RelE [Salinivibrio sp. PR6]
MSHALHFIETPTFTRLIAALASDDELKELQSELIAQPVKGDLIQGTGGLRKVRMAKKGQGKSGSLRVLYYFAYAETIYLVYVYAKTTQDTLTNEEKKQLKELVKQLRGDEK